MHTYYGANFPEILAVELDHLLVLARDDRLAEGARKRVDDLQVMV